MSQLIRYAACFSCKTCGSFALKVFFHDYFTRKGEKEKTLAARKNKKKEENEEEEKEDSDEDDGDKLEDDEEKNSDSDEAEIWKVRGLSVSFLLV